MKPPSEGDIVRASASNPHKPEGHVFGLVYAVDGDFVEVLPHGCLTACRFAWRGPDGINNWVEFDSCADKEHARAEAEEFYPVAVRVKKDEAH